MANLNNLTKKQLIEIIDRKDNVEKQLRDEVKILNKQISDARLTEEGLNVKIQDLESRIKNSEKDMDGTVEALKDAKDSICVLEADYAKLQEQHDEVANKADVYIHKSESLEDKIKDLRLERNVAVAAAILIALCLILFI